VSLSGSRAGFLGRLLGVFKPKDPLVRNIEESIVLMDRMIRSIESSRKSLEMTLEEHKRKMKLSGAQDKELQEIIDEENRNIMGYLNLFTKVYYDLTRVRLRLETITQVQEPMKVLPEVLEELKRIEPEVEKINPQLVSLIRMIEQKVGSIQVSTNSSSVPQLYTGKYTRLTTSTTSEPLVRQVDSTAGRQSEREANGASPGKTLPLPPVDITPPENPPLQAEALSLQRQSEGGSINDVPVNIVEQWILAELRSKAGILDVQSFATRYRVTREKVYEALRRLEEKGLVKLKRF